MSKIIASKLFTNKKTVHQITYQWSTCFQDDGERTQQKEQQRNRIQAKESSYWQLNNDRIIMRMYFVSNLLPVYDVLYDYLFPPLNLYIQNKIVYVERIFTFQTYCVCVVLFERWKEKKKKL